MNKIKTWEEIESDFHHMNNMSCRPDFRKLSTGYVMDENQSVKWNREQVELNNQNYQKAVAELNIKKNKARDAVYEDIFKKIQHEVGHSISRNSAIKIWNYAYAEGHSCGWMNIKAYLDEIIDLVSEILDEQDRELE